MRILLVNKYWYLRGGTETVLFATKKLLEDHGHTVEVFGMKDDKNIFTNKYFIDKIDYQNQNLFQKIIHAFKFVYNKDAKNKFEELVKEFQPDVVHFHNIYHQLSFSLLAVIKKYNLPAVMTLHDYQLISPNYNLFHHNRIDESCLNGKYYKCLYHNCLENISATWLAVLTAYFVKWKKYPKYIRQFISPSQFLKNKFVESGFSPDKITVIGNPISIEKIDYVDGEGVVYFGRLSMEKGLDILLVVAKSLPNINFKIAGVGPVEVDLKQKIDQEGIKNVSLVGFKKGRDLDDLINNSRLVIAPSVWYENCPLSVLEAVTAGKLVIASRIGGLPEILSDDLLFETGNVTELAEKINFWYNQPLELRQQKSQELIKNLVQKYSPEHYWQELIKVYEKTME